MVNVLPSGMVWLGMSVTMGGSFISVTVNVAGSSSQSPLGSVALKVMVSEPCHCGLGIVIVTMRLTMFTVSCVFPV